MHETLSQHFTAPPPILFLVGEYNQEGRAQLRLHDSFPVRFRKRITLNDGYLVISGRKGKEGAKCLFSFLFSTTDRGVMLIFGSQVLYARSCY